MRTADETKANATMEKTSRMAIRQYIVRNKDLAGLISELTGWEH